MAAPTNLTFPTVAYNSIILNWTPGLGSNNTLIIRKQGSIPTSRTDGTQVYLDNGNAFIDTGLTDNTNYCYALYGTDGTEYGEPIIECRKTLVGTMLVEENIINNYKVTKFTIGSSVSSLSTTWIVPSGVTLIDVFLVGGGGGGGGSDGAGGGGGFVYAKSGLAVSPNQEWTILVGAGGSGGPISGHPGYFGEASEFRLGSNILRVEGGFPGGSYYSATRNGVLILVGKGGDGGSGGSSVAAHGVGSGAGGSDGGNGDCYTSTYCGTAGNYSDGFGIDNRNLGVLPINPYKTTRSFGDYDGTVYSGGGGGGTYNRSGWTGAGGVGGGGNGGYRNQKGGNGIPNTGGGGGGAGWTGGFDTLGGSGGSGVVIIRYVIP
jgi:hypothetical protein